MRNANFLIGVAIGAGLVYMLDPQSGRRRRALVRDKVVRARHVARDTVESTRRDALNRARGLMASSKSRLRHEEVDDEVLVERVRSKLGRVCSHPHAVKVLAAHGNITLRGPVLAHEAPSILKTVARVRGVKDVMDQLDLHETADNVPALQGEAKTAPSRQPDELQPNWAPATRAMVAAASLAAVGMGVARYARH